MTTPGPVIRQQFIASMDDDALAAAVSTLAAHIHAATYRLLVLIAELDRREVWAAQGALTCAHWLSWACGIDTHTAREKVRVARALTELPLLSEALAKGELGYSKVRALTRIATSENEADLLNIGLHGTAQHVEKFVRLYRRAKRAEETERADTQHENRGLTFWHEDDGTVVLHGRFPPEMGARILSALDAAMAAHATEQPAAGWDNESLAPEDVPRGTSERNACSCSAHTATDSDVGNGRHRAPEGGCPSMSHRRPTWDVLPRTVAHGAPGRCAGVDGRADVRIERCPRACPGPARNRRPCRSGRARRRPSGTLRNRAPHRHRGGDGSAAVLRRRNRPCRGRTERGAAQCGTAHPQHSAGGAPRAREP